MLKSFFLLSSAFKASSISYTLKNIKQQRINYLSSTRMANSRSSDDFIDMAEDLDLTDRGGKRGTRGGRSHSGRSTGRGGRGERAGGSGRGEMNREVAISKALSKLLRHAAVDVGLKLDTEGYARVDQVMQWQRLKSLHITFDDVRTATTDNAKQRFSMKLNPALNPPPDSESNNPSDWIIRANQGHSIAVDSAALLTPVTVEAGNVPDVVVHGTYFGLYQTILDSGGLKKMSRNHIHFSTGLPEGKQGVISGMRNDAELLIYIDIKKSLADGGVWWLSENGVVLTEGNKDGILSTRYWQKVEGRKQDVGLLWENGKEVGELPHNLKNKKAPHGKQSKAPVPKERLAQVVVKGKGKLTQTPEELDAKECLAGDGP